jgi:hypothetical protein
MVDGQPHITLLCSRHYERAVHKPHTRRKRSRSRRNGEATDEPPGSLVFVGGDTCGVTVRSFSSSND